MIPMITHCILATRAYGLDILDGPYSDFSNFNGFGQECTQARDLGFDGKTLIHPGPDRGLQRDLHPAGGGSRTRAQDHRRVRPAGERLARRDPAGRPDGRAAARRHGEAHDRDRGRDRGGHQGGVRYGLAWIVGAIRSAELLASVDRGRVEAISLVMLRRIVPAARSWSHSPLWWHRAQTRSMSRSTKGWVRASASSSIPSALSISGNSSAACGPCRTSSSDRPAKPGVRWRCGRIQMH